MNVLVIGLGSMGKRRIRLLKRFDQVENIVGVDARKDRRDETKAEYGCKVYESIEGAMKHNKSLECAFVCTSPLAHNSIISEALQRDLHVFSEINLVADGYKRNMELAREKNKTLFLSSTFYYREEIRFLREKLSDKKNLNYIYHIGQYLPDWHPWESYTDFFVGDRRTNGCREIMAIELPWITGVFGDVQSVNVISDNMTKLHIPYKDNYMIQLVHESGNKGCMIIDVVSPKAVRNLEIYGENVYFSWDGSPLGLEYFDETDRIMKPAKLYDNAEQLEGYSSFVVENAYQNEIAEFLNTVACRSQPPYGFSEDLKVLKLIDQIGGET